MNSWLINAGFRSADGRTGRRMDVCKQNFPSHLAGDNIQIRFTILVILDFCVPYLSGYKTGFLSL